MKLLILGGTVEARQVATQIYQTHPNILLITSLAGATKTTPKVPGEIHIGGFGGVDGLTDYLQNNRIDAVIDATHPFALTITNHGVQSCHKVKVPYLRLDRPRWIVPTDTDVIFTLDADEAARLIARTSKSAFLTIGRKDLVAFESLKKVKLLVRAIEQPDPNLNLEQTTFVTARPPFALVDEMNLMRNHQIDTLVSKDSGGDSTRAKLDAAAQLGIRIILLRRPPPPDGDCVSTINDALAWLTKQGTFNE